MFLLVALVSVSLQSDTQTIFGQAGVIEVSGPREWSRWLPVGLRTMSRTESINGHAGRAPGELHIVAAPAHVPGLSSKRVCRGEQCGGKAGSSHRRLQMFHITYSQVRLDEQTVAKDLSLTAAVCT